MTRYIDVDALLDLFNGDDVGIFIVSNIDSMIDDNELPTFDTVPVKHGKWIKTDSQQYFRKHYPTFTCSECGQRKEGKRWNYCPNCGAKMREEE